MRVLEQTYNYYSLQGIQHNHIGDSNLILVLSFHSYITWVYIWKAKREGKQRRWEGERCSTCVWCKQRVSLWSGRWSDDSWHSPASKYSDRYGLNRGTREGVIPSPALKQKLPVPRGGWLHPYRSGRGLWGWGWGGEETGEHGQHIQVMQVATKGGREEKQRERKRSGGKTWKERGERRKTTGTAHGLGRWVADVIPHFCSPAHIVPPYLKKKQKKTS